MNDDELLNVLSMALAAPRIEPDADQLVLLHRMIETQRTLPGRRRRRVLVPAAITGLALLTGSGSAFALSGAPLPDQLRVAARAVGLPVESPRLAHARLARRRLMERLERDDRAAISVASTELGQSLQSLSSTERLKLPDAAVLQQWAVDRTSPETTSPEDQSSPQMTLPPDEATTPTGVPPTDLVSDAGSAVPDPAVGGTSASTPPTTATPPVPSTAPATSVASIGPSVGNPDATASNGGSE